MFSHVNTTEAFALSILISSAYWFGAGLFVFGFVAVMDWLDSWLD